MTGCHIIDPRNLGDQVCCPLDYFPEWESAPRANFPDWESVEGFKVFGGGGIFHPGILDILARISRNPKGKIVVWGAGINLHGQTELVWPQFLQSWDLVGLRDTGNPWEYVPCASCLHPAFDVTREPVHEVVCYSHWEYPLGFRFRTMTNSQPKEIFPDVLDFIGSGKVLLTNTFHGAYWGLLLGRKVVVVNPFSNRFLGFKPKIEFCTPDTWHEAAEKSVPAVGYLEECRDLNLKFAEKVKGVL